MPAHTRGKTSAAGAHLFLGALPYVAMGVVAGVEVSPQRYMGFLTLLALGPALASVSRGAISTAIIGMEALGLCVGLSFYDNFYRLPHGLVASATIASVTVVGVVASAGRQRRERELADIRVVAEIAQAVLQRPAPREVPGARIAVRYMSATAAARIGGDLYEVIATPERVRLIVGDVQGKGVAAVRTASMVLSAFREAAYDARDLAEIAGRIERSMRHQAAEQEFVTAVLAQMTPDAGVIEILNCGHPSPLLVRDGNAVPAESPDPGLPLGLSSLLDTERRADTWPLEPGTRILFYTDGISEARNKAGAFYPLSQCGQILAGNDPDKALDLLRDQVVRHVGHKLTDDAAMLLVSTEPIGVVTGAVPGQSVPARSAPAEPVPAETVPVQAVPGDSVPSLG